MKQVITLADLKKTACAHLNSHLFIENSEFTKKGEKQKRQKKVSKEKTLMHYRLSEHAKENYLELKTEYRFDEERKWRFDWCFPELKIAIEYEGIFSAKSRHTTAKGFTGDTEKYNRAQQLGWRVMRYTAINYMDLIIDLKNIK